MAMTSKEKEPRNPNNAAIEAYYKNNGDELISYGIPKIGKRFDLITGRKFKKDDGSVISNDVTLSQPASEVLTLIRKDNDWYIVMGIQSRSPFLVSAGGKIYLKKFFEQVGGLVEDGDDFLSTAIKEAAQELGAKIKFISELISPILYKHVSYTDEVSKLYWAIAETLVDQNLDDGESINVQLIRLSDAKKEYFSYLNGLTDSFFGFDIPDITMLSLLIFFWKLETGEINLNKPVGNLI